MFWCNQGLFGGILVLLLLFGKGSRIWCFISCGCSWVVEHITWKCGSVENCPSVL